MSLQEAWGESGLSVEELWVRYFGLGGTADVSDVDAYLARLGGLVPHQHNILAVALNEWFMELGRNHPVAYLGD